MYHFVFVEDLVAIVIPDYATVTHNNVLDIFQLEDPQIFKLYDVNRAQMYGGAKCAVTNNLSLLCEVKWYTRLFRPPCQMKDSPYERTIVPAAKGYIQVPTM